MATFLLCLALSFACVRSAVSYFLNERVQLSKDLQHISAALDTFTELEAMWTDTATSKVSSADIGPRHPQVPKRFAAPFISAGTYGSWTKNKSLFAQDVNQRAMTLSSYSTSPFLANFTPPIESLNTVLLLASSSYMIRGDHEILCRSGAWVSRGFHDMFGWASSRLMSRYIGNKTVGSRPCLCWQPRIQPPQTHVVLCTHGNFPVELSIISKSKSGDTKQNITFTFDAPTAVGDRVNASLFVKPEECSKLALPCSTSKSKPTMEVDAYVFHPGMSAVDFNISGQNVADDVGEASFICTDRMNKPVKYIDHNYTLISRYTIVASAAWGQYAMCNGYPDTSPPGPSCVGGDPRLVGRATPMGIGDGELRCAAASPIGFWFSLPADGRCAQGVVPGSDASYEGCTWTPRKRLKTISQACLLQTQRFVDKCFADIKEGKGYTKSTEVLRAAFESENVQQGGCAEVSGPLPKSKDAFFV